MTTNRASILFLALVSTAAPGAPPASSGDPAVNAQLQSALQRMVAPLAAPPGQSTRPIERSQGALHASLVALAQVCSHDNPSAERSAICRPISPE